MKAKILPFITILFSISVMSYQSNTNAQTSTKDCIAKALNQRHKDSLNSEVIKELALIVGNVVK